MQAEKPAMNKEKQAADEARKAVVFGIPVETQRLVAEKEARYGRRLTSEELADCEDLAKETITARFYGKENCMSVETSRLIRINKIITTLRGRWFLSEFTPQENP